MLKLLFRPFLLLAVFSFAAASARADYEQRLSLGLGIAQTKNPSQTSLIIGAEYEYRLDPLVGLGGFGDYIFSNPGITLLGLPEVFFHPIGNDWLINAAPLIEFGSGTGTHVGVRVGTRVPIPLGPIALIPEVAVDIIAGGPNYIFGLGIQI